MGTYVDILVRRYFIRQPAKRIRCSKGNVVSSTVRRGLALATVTITSAAGLTAGSAYAGPAIRDRAQSVEHVEATDRAAPTPLMKGWKIQSSAVVAQDGAAVSDPRYATDGWLPISQPETLMAG